MTLKFSTRQNNQVLFVPLIIKELEPVGGPDSEIIQRHGKMREIIKQYELDLENYGKELEKIRQNSIYNINVTENDEWMTQIDIEDDELLRNLLSILSSSEAEFDEQYKIAKQAQKEKMLSDKYREAIEWRGPLFRGVVDRWKGFAFVVYSDDHGEHLHIKHGEKGIDARYSFPDIELIDYKRSKKIISRKEEKEIKNILTSKTLFEKLKKEFDKRPKK